jgi:hypothetical protein
VQAYLGMKVLRDDLNDPEIGNINDSFALAVKEKAKASWFDMRDMYCGYAKRGLEPSMTYTNLDGNTEDCRK